MWYRNAQILYQCTTQIAIRSSVFFFVQNCLNFKPFISRFSRTSSRSLSDWCCFQPIRSRLWFWRGLEWLESNGSFIWFLKTLNYYLLTDSSLVRCFQITNQFMVSDGRIWNHPIQNFSFLITRSFSRIKKTKKRSEIGPQMN